MCKVIELKPKEEELTEEVEESGIEEAIRRNEENRKRMEQERLKANKKVLKSYRIKK